MNESSRERAREAWWTCWTHKGAGYYCAGCVTAALDDAARERNALGNLLAVIHQDGGRYAEAHGDVKAAADAEAIVLVLRERVAGLEGALDDALATIRKYHEWLADIGMSRPTVKGLDHRAGENAEGCDGCAALGDRHHGRRYKQGG